MNLRAPCFDYRQGALCFLHHQKAAINVVIASFSVENALARDIM